ncbi:MAG: carbamoylphosphate synthase large subunit [Polaribacter sp.]|jgi:carbamoylphosphate synthase large subunit
MKRILILGGSYLQNHFIKTALNLGIKVFVIDGNSHCYAAINGLGEFYPIDFSKIEIVKNFCIEKKINTIIPPVNELGNLIAAKIAAELNFYYNSVAVVRCSMDKKLFWEKLEISNFNKLKSYTIDKLGTIQYPVIVKPTVSTGSKGVSLVRNFEEVKKAIDYAKQFGKTDDIRIEEFIDGNQFSLETISFKGKHYLLAVIEEHLSNEPYFFERTDILDSEQHDSNCNYFTPFVDLLLTNLGVECGPCHIEVRVKDDKIYLIDFATRSGGWRDIMLYNAGINYNLLILKCYLEEDVFRKELDRPNNTVGAGILLYHEDILALKAAQESNKICESFINGEVPKLEPRTLADAYGYYFVKSNKKNELVGILPKFKLNIHGK